MRTTVAISLAALTLLGACSKGGGSGDQANNGGDNAGPSASSGGGDEKITLAQFQQRQVDRIMRDDANNDGKVSKDEFVAAMKARIAERQANGGDDSGAPAPDPEAIANRVFTRMDTNADGFITKDELQKSAAAQFAQLDTDHKGYVTRDEMRARFAARGGGGGGFGGGGPGGPGGGGGQGGGDNGGGGN
jgi:Ca2+-binding EF-hand superfamily protein